jgi:hypothetical protein
VLILDLASLNTFLESEKNIWWKNIY